MRFAATAAILAFATAPAFAADERGGPAQAARGFPAVPSAMAAFEAPAFATGEDGLPRFRYDLVRHDEALFATEVERSIEVDQEDQTATETIVVNLALAGAAETHVSLTQAAVDNVIVEDGATQRNSIESSFNLNTGIIGVNQTPGSANDQANVVAIALGEAGLAHVQVAVKQELANNTTTVTDSARENRIVDSFNDTVGIVGVNQAAGNLNLQANVVAIAIGAGVEPVSGLLAMSDISLGQVSSGNTNAVDDETQAASRNTRTNSFNNFVGIAQVNQAAGDGNVMTKVVGISVNVVNP